MAKFHRRIIACAAAAVLLLCFAAAIGMLQNALPCGMGKTALRLLRHLIHTGLLLWWIVSIRRRILHGPARRYLLGIGLLLLTWLLLRICKWEFALPHTTLHRLCWYGFYLPIVFVPLLGLFLAGCCARAEGSGLPRRSRLLYLPASLLVLGVWSNDLHHLMFRFPQGEYEYDTVYTYGPLYLLTALWCIALGVWLVALLLHRRRASGRRFLRLLPGLSLGGAMLFALLYSLRLVDADQTAVNCVLVVALLESAIQSGQIPANTHYDALFRASSVPGEITDREDRVVYSTLRPCAVTPQERLQARRAPVLRGTHRLNSAPITGGYVYWMDDVSQTAELADRLQHTCEVLREENGLLRAELELKEKRARVEEQNRLYDRIFRQMSPQLAQMSGLVQRAGAHPEQGRALLPRVCVLGAYVKRCGNLVLLGEDAPAIPARELEYCMRESLDNLQLCGTAVSMSSSCTGTLTAASAAAVYRCFEEILERALPAMNALLLQLTSAGGGVSVRLSLGCGAFPLPECPELTALGGRVQMEVQEEDVSIRILLPKEAGMPCGH